MVSGVICDTVIFCAIVTAGCPRLSVEQAAEGIGPNLGNGRKLVHRSGVAFLFALAQAQQGGQQQRVRFHGRGIG